jgi:hypothetical protein
LQKWYPYLLLLILLSIISIANEKIVTHKNKIITKKQYEYKMALNQLKENNHYLPYYQKKTIREKAAKRGFMEKQKDVYKIRVNDK